MISKPIATPEDFKSAAAEWEAIEWAGSQGAIPEAAGARQLELERAMERSGFEFDEDGDVIGETGREG